MPSSAPETLSCPSCGAPLEYDGRSTLVQCRFCRTTAVLPSVETQSGTLTTPSMLDAMEQIRSLAASGNLIEAIRRYRALTKTSLKIAKEAVEMLASGQLVAAPTVVPGPLTAEQTGRILEEVQELLRAGDRVAAVRRYREAMDVSQTRADFVIRQIEAAQQGLPPPVFPKIEGLPSTFKPERLVRRGISIVVILALSGVLLAGGFIAFLLSLPGGPFNPRLLANGPAALSPADAEVPGLAAAFYQADDETWTMGMLDPDDGKLLWQSDALPGRRYVDALLSTGDHIVAVSQAHLLVYDAADGSLLWQALMPDRLNVSVLSLLVTGGRVITSNLDQSIQAYDLATGRLVWDRRLEGYDRGLRLVDGALLLFDYLGDDYTYSLVFLDPLDGRETRVITPSCATGEYSQTTIDPGSGFFVDEAGDSLYLVYDSSPGCIQRLDLSNGAVAWTTLDDTWYSFSSDGVPGLFAGESLYFSTGNRLLAVDKTTGHLQLLLEEEDYEILPLAVSGDTLLLRLLRTRGTDQFELRGFDVSAAEIAWHMPLLTAEPLDPPDEMSGLLDEGDLAWTLHLDSSGLYLLLYQAVPNQVIIRTVDPAQGRVTDEKTVPLESVTGEFYSVPRIIAWQGDLVYFSLDGRIFCLDFRTGELLFHFQ